jgi:uncharacterized RDD family membrane protein YckC
MSDMSQGPGWWQASDGKWYSPEQAPATAATPPPTAPPTAPPGPGYGPPTGPPPFGAPGAGPGFGSPGGFGAPAAAPGQLVPWSQRVMATLIDLGLVVAAFVVIFIVAVILGAIADALGALVMLLGYLALAAVSYFYFPYLTGQTGQSPGKRLIGIKVVAEATGQPIGGGMGIARQFAHLLDGFCMIGYLFPLWDPKKQTFADKIVSTVVISGPKQSFGPELFKP